MFHVSPLCLLDPREEVPRSGLISLRFQRRQALCRGRDCLLDGSHAGERLGLLDCRGKGLCALCGLDLAQDDRGVRDQLFLHGGLGFARITAATHGGATGASAPGRRAKRSYADQSAESSHNHQQPSILQPFRIAHCITYALPGAGDLYVVVAALVVLAAPIQVLLQIWCVGRQGTVSWILAETAPWPGMLVGG
eukprot:scaffold3634_cov33-Phaeocystis_antarctica.AAC.1